jgi:hypothetical protein
MLAPLRRQRRRSWRRALRRGEEEAAGLRPDLRAREATLVQVEHGAAECGASLESLQAELGGLREAVVRGKGEPRRRAVIEHNLTGELARLQRFARRLERYERSGGRTGPRSTRIRREGPRHRVTTNRACSAPRAVGRRSRLAAPHGRSQKCARRWPGAEKHARRHETDADGPRSKPHRYACTSIRRVTSGRCSLPNSMPTLCRVRYCRSLPRLGAGGVWFPVPGRPRDALTNPLSWGVA